jgi:RND superfamily putative drug exporter
MVFALLFGLSMDYEVFLVGRMRRNGSRRTIMTRPSSPALPMQRARSPRRRPPAAVFGCFIVAEYWAQGVRFALAIAVILDATIVRCSWCLRS